MSSVDGDSKEGQLPDLDMWLDDPPAPIGRDTAQESRNRRLGFRMGSYNTIELLNARVDVWEMLRTLELHPDEFLIRLEAWFGIVAPSHRLEDLNDAQKQVIIYGVYCATWAMTVEESRELQEQINKELRYLWSLDAALNHPPGAESGWCYTREWHGYDPQWIIDDNVLPNVDKVWVLNSKEWKLEFCRLTRQARTELNAMELYGEFTIDLKTIVVDGVEMTRFTGVSYLGPHEPPTLQVRARSLAGLPLN